MQSWSPCAGKASLSMCMAEVLHLGVVHLEWSNWGWEDLGGCDRGHSVAWSRMCLWCLRLTWPREELFGVGCSTWHHLSAAPKSLLKNRDPILNPNLSDALWISLILFFEISDVLRIEGPDLVYWCLLFLHHFSISLCFTVPIASQSVQGPDVSRRLRPLVRTPAASSGPWPEWGEGRPSRESGALRHGRFRMFRVTYGRYMM